MFRGQHEWRATGVLPVANHRLGIRVTVTLKTADSPNPGDIYEDDRVEFRWSTLSKTVVTFRIVAWSTCRDSLVVATVV